MPIDEHYEQEDMVMVYDEVDNMIQVALKMKDCAEKGVFIDKDKYMGELESSYQVLKMLNDKKIRRDNNYEQNRQYF
ncbi:hypothetical protein GCM10007063_05960 [Lentibacillus kapialis]|uniref:Uncharacterized protein n=1 Tax=Lentibacillus kapialis TaxID=340214 RepID=A0A917PPI6_9BACI|nr:hypothetical protein [Lentibacillus kapialis]GGJ86277.1 hypothetical protein GCM10007063_05960 [Lentibacillus kapialis]